MADPAKEYAATITGADMSAYLNILAADDMEGRATGTAGNAKAAEYLVKQISDFGIPPVAELGSYEQEVNFTRIKMAGYALTINDKEYTFLKDFMVFPESMPEDELSFNADQLVFAGYGIDDPLYSDYTKAAKFAGKTLLIYGGEPFDDDGNSLITGSIQFSDWSTSFDKKLKTAKAYGATGVIIISTNFLNVANSQRNVLLNGRMIMGKVASPDEVIPHLIISTNVLKDIVGTKLPKVIKVRDKAKKSGKLKPFKIKTDLSTTLSRSVSANGGSNILAYVEGSDPEVKDEVIVVTAHYDHVGVKGTSVFNGADDNASGTSGVLEMAQAFQIAKENGHGPRRSVLCMLVTGEEIGLLGSQYYSENPVFPLENTVANVNIDMIGRTDKAHSNPEYIYVIGSDRLSTELHEINESVNTKYTGVELDYTYNAKDDPNQFYYRSDHYNFAKNGVPAIFYFSGVHADYHRPTDTADKIMFDKAALIAQLAFHTTWELANRPERIKVDVTN